MRENARLVQRREPLTDLGGRTEFERDYTAILFSHAFRRLRQKTQVFHFPMNDHISTRLDHSLYVASTSSIICRNLRNQGIECDPVLSSAIGLGHDLGHTPFGHAGERVLNKILNQHLNQDSSDSESPEILFSHEKNSLRVVDKIEKPKTEKTVGGLNLTLAVRDGIVNHNGESLDTSVRLSDIPDFLDVGKSVQTPCSLEGCIVRLVDKVSYLGRDIEDALIAGLISETSIPAQIRVNIGSKNGEIVEYFVKDIIDNTDHMCAKLSINAAEIMNELLKFNYHNIYKIEIVQEYFSRLEQMLQILFEKFLESVMSYKDDISKYENDHLKSMEILGKFIEDRKLLYFRDEMFDTNDELYLNIVIDFISTLTDRFVFDAFTELFQPRFI